MEAPHSCSHEDEVSLTAFTPGRRLPGRDTEGQHHLAGWLPGRGTCGSRAWDGSGVIGVTIGDRMEQEV